MRPNPPSRGELYNMEDYQGLLYYADKDGFEIGIVSTCPGLSDAQLLDGKCGLQ